MAETIETKRISKITLADNSYQVRHVDAADLPISAAELSTLFPKNPNVETAQEPETISEVNN